MRRIWPLFLALGALVCVADVSAGSPDAGTRPASKRRAPPPPPKATVAVDPCAEFNQRQHRISAEEHQRRYGCPPCPCACTGGKITCAPCAACKAFGDSPEAVPVQPTPQKDAGR